MKGRARLAPRPFCWFGGRNGKVNSRNYFPISLAFYVIICTPILLTALYFDCALITMILLIVALALVTSGGAAYLELKNLPKRQAKIARKKEKEVLQFMTQLITGTWLLDVFNTIKGTEPLGTIEQLVCIGCVVISIGIFSWYYRNL